MIQRIQSILLTLVIAISIILFFIPLGEKMDIQGALQNIQVKSHIELILIGIIICCIALYAILMYKKRPLQMKLCRLGLLMSVAQMVVVFLLAEEMPGEGKVHYLLGTYLTAIQPVLFFIARRFIWKDEQLVKSADRIR
jgi:hypothetical protein